MILVRFRHWIFFAFVLFAISGNPSVPNAQTLNGLTVCARQSVEAQLGWALVAEQQGFYTTENLHVQWRLDNVKSPLEALQGKECDLAIARLGEFILTLNEALLENKNAHLVHIAQIYPTNALRLMGLPGLLRKLDEYKHITLASCDEEKNEIDIIMRALLAIAWDYEDDDEITCGYGGEDPVAALLTGNVDLIGGTLYDEAYRVAAAQGTSVDELDMFNPGVLKRLNFDIPEEAIIAREDFLADAKKKELAVRFVRASLKGLALAKDPSTVVGAVLDKNKAANRAHQEYAAQVIAKMIGAFPEGRLGWLTPEQYENALRFFKKFGPVHAERAEFQGALRWDIWEAATGVH